MHSLSCDYRGMENDYANDNDELSFITLSAATRNVTRYLVHSEDEQREIVQPDKRDGGRANNGNDKDQRADIERRVSDILAMENRLRRKRNQV